MVINASFDCFPVFAMKCDLLRKVGVDAPDGGSLRMSEMLIEPGALLFLCARTKWPTG